MAQQFRYDSIDDFSWSHIKCNGIADDKPRCVRMNAMNAHNWKFGMTELLKKEEEEKGHILYQKTMPMTNTGI